MLLDHRTYTCRPGTIAKHLKLYEEMGFAPQRRHLGDPIVYAFTESGPLNTYVHIWVYEDAADRAKKRAGLWADADWLAYVAKSSEAGYLVAQENKLMTTVSFVPVKLPTVPAV